MLQSLVRQEIARQGSYLAPCSAAHSESPAQQGSATTTGVVRADGKRADATRSCLQLGRTKMQLDHAKRRKRTSSLHSQMPRSLVTTAPAATCQSGGISSVQPFLLNAPASSRAARFSSARSSLREVGGSHIFFRTAWARQKRKSIQDEPRLARLDKASFRA